MRKLGEKYVPVAKLKMTKSKKPGTKKRSTAIRLNQHDYNKRTQMWDFVVGVCADIRDGECRPDRDSIEAHEEMLFNASARGLNIETTFYFPRGDWWVYVQVLYEYGISGD